MAIYTDEEIMRTNEINALIMRVNRGMLELHGGYPPTWALLGDHIVIASAWGGEPQLEIAPLDTWLTRTRAEIAEWDDKEEDA